MAFFKMVRRGFIPETSIGKGKDTTWREGARHKAQACRSHRRKAARRAKAR